uniref:Phosphoprotein n=1 Tax=Eptesicus fuscus orthorubulavirus TaxID=2884705 RepID=A0A8K1NCF3_9MONO|nr:P [Eptesicus fuscus orthorubulavirus] [Eptesicus fuscus orthorubulavirus]
MSFEMSEEEINELLETGMASADAALTALNLNQAAKPDSGHLNDHNYTKLNPNQPQKIPIMVQEPQIERKIAQPLYPSLTGTEPNDQPKFTMVSSAPQTGLILSGPEKPPAAPTSRSDDLTSMAKKNLLSQNQDPMWSSTNPAGNKGSAPFKRGGNPFVVAPKQDPPCTTGIGGSIQYPGSVERQQSLSGVTQYAPRLNPFQVSKSADADSVPPNVNFVSSIMDFLKQLETRLERIEGKVDKITSWQTVIQQTKNDTQQIKGALATIEGLITTMKIMDPGVPSKVSLNQYQNDPTRAPICVTGVGDVTKYVDNEHVIMLDQLARPIPVNVRKLVEDKRSPTRLEAAKITVREMMQDLFDEGDTLRSYIERINAAQTETELQAIKSAALRSMT